MNINPKTGIKLTKREREILTHAAVILKLIEKHGDSDCESISARLAAGNIDTTLEYLTPIDESTLVGAK